MVKEGLFDINFISSNSSNENTNKTFDAIHTISAEVKTAEKEIDKLNYVNKKHHSDNNGFPINLQSKYDLSKVSIPLNNIYKTSGEALHKEYKNTIISMDDDILPDTSGFESTIRKQRKTIDELLVNNEELKKNLQASKDRIIQLEGENKRLTGEKQELENQLARNQELLRENEAELFRKLRDFLTRVGERTKGYRAEENALNLRREGDPYLRNLKNYLDVCSQILVRQIERNNQESEDDKREIEELKQQKVGLEQQIIVQRNQIAGLIADIDNNRRVFEIGREDDGRHIANLIEFIRQQEADYNALNVQLNAQQALVAQLQPQLVAVNQQNALLQAQNANIIAQRDALQVQLNASLFAIQALQNQIANFQVLVAGMLAGNVALQGQIAGLQGQINQLNLDHANDLLALQQLIEQKDAEIAQLDNDNIALQAQNAVKDADILALQAQNAVKDADILALQAQNAVKDADILALQAQNAVKDADIIALQAQVAVLQADNDAKDITIAQLNIDNGLKDADILALQQQNEQKDLRIAVLRAQNAGLRARNTAKDVTIAGLQAQIQRLRSQTVIKDIRINGLRIENDQKDNQLGVLATEIANLRAMVALRDADIVARDGVIAMRDADIVARDADIAIKDNRIERLEVQLDLAIESRDKNITRRKALGIQIYRLQNILTERRKTIEEKNTAIADLTQERDSALERNAELSAEVEAKDNIIIALKAENTSLKKRLKESNSLRERFRVMGNVLKREKRELLIESDRKDLQIRRLERRLNDNGQLNADLTRQLEALKEENERIKARLTQLDELLRQSDTQLKAKDTTIARLTAQLSTKDRINARLRKNLVKSKIKLKDLRGKNDDLQLRIHGTYQQLEDEKETNAQLQLENKEGKRQIEAEREENEQLNAQLKQLRDENANLQERIDATAEELKTEQRAKGQLQVENEDFKEQIEAKQREIKELNTQLGQINTERDTARQRIRELTDEIFTMNQSLTVKQGRIDQLDRNSLVLQERINDLQRQLEAKDEEIAQIRAEYNALALFRRRRIAYLSLALQNRIDFISELTKAFSKKLESDIHTLNVGSLKNSLFKVKFNPDSDRGLLTNVMSLQQSNIESKNLQSENDNLKREISKKDQYILNIIESIQKIEKDKDEKVEDMDDYRMLDTFDDELDAPPNYTGQNIPTDLEGIKAQIGRLRNRISQMISNVTFEEFKKEAGEKIQQQEDQILLLQKKIEEQRQSLQGRETDFAEIAGFTTMLSTQRVLTQHLRTLLWASEEANGKWKIENEELKLGIRILEQKNQASEEERKRSEEENRRLEQRNQASEEERKRSEEENRILTEAIKKQLDANDVLKKKNKALLIQLLHFQNQILYISTSKMATEEQMQERISELLQKNSELEQKEREYKETTERQLQKI